MAKGDIVEATKQAEIGDALRGFQRLEANRRMVKYAIDDDGIVQQHVARFDAYTGEMMESIVLRVDVAQLHEQRAAHAHAIALLDEEIAAIEAAQADTGEKKNDGRA